MNQFSIPVEWLPQYTYNDYKTWEGDWELIRGLAYAMSPSPLRKHQALGGRFVTFVNNALSEKPGNCKCEVLYETDWIVDEHTVIRPDVMIVCDQPSSDFVRIPPVLTLEILSPESRLKDRNIKYRIYEQNGVKYYLIADPDKESLEMFMLKDNRYVECSGSSFQLTVSCQIQLNLSNLWQ